MRDPFEITSNVLALAVIASVTYAALNMPKRLELRAVEGPGVELSLEVADAEPEPPKPEPEPEQPKAEQPPPVPEPTPPEPPPPPPTPEEPPPEPPKEEPLPPEAVEPLKDEDGAPPPPPVPVPPPISEEAAQKFKSCLASKNFYPSSREARKKKPKEPVQYIAVFEGDKIVTVEIEVSSGSPPFDAAAKAAITKSDCGSRLGLKGEAGSVKGTIHY
jgi:outer membrane biosynthesis protein TonB